MQSKNVGQALNEFDRAQALDPYISTFYYDAAKTLSLAGEGDKALAILKKVATKDEHYTWPPGIPRARGDEAGAQAEYEEAIKINPLGAGFYGKGKILLAAKKSSRPARHFAGAAGAQPTYPEAHQGMAEVLLDRRSTRTPRPSTSSRSRT